MIYDLPDMAHITRAVVVKLSIVSVVCIVFLAAEVIFKFEYIRLQEDY